MTFKVATPLIAVAFVTGSIIAAAAQSGSSQQMPRGAGASGPVSAETHCLDRATGQPKLKTAQPGNINQEGTSGSAGGATSGSRPGSTSGSASGSPSMQPGAGGTTAAGLAPC